MINPNPQTADCRIGIKTSTCKICGKPFLPTPQRGWKGTKAIVEEIQTSWFRGDDIVNFYHVDCYKKGVK